VQNSTKLVSGSTRPYGGHSRPLQTRSRRGRPCRRAGRVQAGHFRSVCSRLYTPSWASRPIHQYITHPARFPPPTCPHDLHVAFHGARILEPRVVPGAPCTRLCRVQFGVGVDAASQPCRGRRRDTRPEPERWELVTKATHNDHAHLHTCNSTPSFSTSSTASAKGITGFPSVGVLLLLPRRRGRRCPNGWQH